MELLAEQCDAWQALEELEGTHPIPSAASLAHAVGQVNRCEVARRAQENLILRYQQASNTPPCPPNSHGDRKMPEDWYRPEFSGGPRDRKLYPRSVAASVTVGLQPPGPGKWVARKDLSGGQGLGWLWLCFDANDTIRDVSFD